jgi:hypothetical protein
MGLLKKEDIQSYRLLNKLFRYEYFAKKRFWFFIEWYPSTLAHPDSFGYLLIHDGTRHSIRGFDSHPYLKRGFVIFQGTELVFCSI